MINGYLLYPSYSKKRMMINEVTPVKSYETILNNIPPIIKKNKNPHTIIIGKVTGTISKKEDIIIMEIESSFITNNVKIKNTMELEPVQHLDHFKVCLTYTFNRVLNEVIIINPFVVSKIYIRYLIADNTAHSVKRKLNMDSAIE